MIKTIAFGYIERYSTENYSHSFQVAAYRGYAPEYKNCYVCEAVWNNRIIVTGIASTRIGAIQEALNKLQQTAYRLPFATYRMADILTGQL